MTSAMPSSKFEHDHSCKLNHDLHIMLPTPSVVRLHQQSRVAFKFLVALVIRFPTCLKHAHSRDFLWQSDQPGT